MCATLELFQCRSARPAKQRLRPSKEEEERDHRKYGDLHRSVRLQAGSRRANRDVDLRRNSDAVLEKVRHISGID